MEIIVRKGEKKDLPDVLHLIKELAHYEKAPGEVCNTLELMEEDGFGKNPVFAFFVAEVSGKITGMALYYIKYSTWKGKCLYLEDIIVTEKMRGNKIGNKLFLAVTKESAELNVMRMEWQVLNWNSPAIHFYKKYNAHFDEEWTNCRLTYNQLKDMNH